MSIVTKDKLRADRRTISTAASELLAIDDRELSLTAVISTVDADRSGDVIEPGGLLNRDEFMRNPVVLWAHQRALPPIGVCKSLSITSKRIVAETQFAKGVPFAEDVFRLYVQGVLRAWSIGFVSRQARPRRGGMHVTSWDLLEYSAVPVPENPGALTLAVNKGLVRSMEFIRWIERDEFAGLLMPPTLSVAADDRGAD
jgi:phage head maturation protease